MAKKFRFSLESLLGLRQLKEQQTLGALARVLASYNAYQEEIISKRHELQKGTQSYTELSNQYAKSAHKPQAGLSLKDRQIWDRYFKGLDEQIREAQSKALLMRPELEREQKKVQAARKERKILELLKEKEKAEYVRKIQKKEVKELAELNQKIQLFSRSRLSYTEDQDKGRIK